MNKEHSMLSTLTVIGGGPGGYTAAFAAAGAGMKVTLVEKSALGGTCLHRGCIPTKSLKASADALSRARRLDAFGIDFVGEPTVNLAAVLNRKNKVITALTEGLARSCAALGVTVIRGEGRVSGPGSVSVETPEGRRVLASDRILLAIGSSPLELPSLPFDHVRILSSDDMLKMPALPRRLAIVGGGVIGCEMACIFRTFGVEVCLIEGLDRLLPLPSVDADVSRLLLREMKKQGIVCKLGTVVKATSVGDDGGVTLSLAASRGEVVGEWHSDAVLVCAGRMPAVDREWFTVGGIDTHPRGWVTVNQSGETSLEGCYAVGDMLGPGRPMLAHTAAAEARRVVDAMLGKNASGEGDLIPSAIFTMPEIGMVGLSEQLARDSGQAVRCVSMHLRELGMAQASGELAGQCKLVLREDDGVILGIHLVGAHATELLGEAGLALSARMTSARLARVVHAHPTLSEIFQETALRATL